MTVQAQSGSREASGGAPALLVSIHDVSPLTVEPCRRALALVEACGVRRDALTMLVIPRHEDRVSIHEHGPTLDWIRGLAHDGATLVTHGLTHRMPGRHLDPWGAWWAHAFARGQGEFFRAPRTFAEGRIASARRLMARAGLEQALHGFVPPAWLLSPEARAAVLGAGFGWYEQLGGMFAGERRLARRVVGFGSLSACEAWVTARVAALQARLPPADTRLAIHPADLERPGFARVVERTLGKLLEGREAQSYAGFFGARG